VTWFAIVGPLVKTFPFECWQPSWISWIAQGYPFDIRYKHHNDLESSKKQTTSVGAT